MAHKTSYHHLPTFIIPSAENSAASAYLQYFRPSIHPGNHIVQCTIYTLRSFTMTTTDPQHTSKCAECFQLVTENDFYTNSGFYGRLNISSKTNADKWLNWYNMRIVTSWVVVGGRKACLPRIGSNKSWPNEEFLGDCSQNCNKSVNPLGVSVSRVSGDPEKNKKSGLPFQ